MPVTASDLSNCDLEPIHIPGKIQSHGFLVVTNNSNIICYVSSNTFTFIGREPMDLLGRPVAVLLLLFEQKADQTDLVFSAGGNTKEHLQLENPFAVAIAGVPYNLIITGGALFTLLEFEPRVPPAVSHLKIIAKAMHSISSNKNIAALVASSAVQVKAITGFDRVMVYKFANDGHGEVIAEAKNDSLESWLGLHYPASDIPRQARELYKLNTTRLIADVDTIAAEIITTKESPDNLDLTNSQLRAVSPVHIRYLKNMGVASSFSISLLYKGELWGLIACHNYTTRFIDFELREAGRIVGQVLSMALEFRQDESRVQSELELYTRVDFISRYMHNNISLEDALTTQETTILQVAHATGAALCFDNKIIPLGNTPGNQIIKELMDWVTMHHNEGIYHTDALPVAFPAIQPFQSIASGVMAIPLSRDWKDCIVWFKEEIIKEVRWAGNPDKPVELSPDGMLNISPRHSFETWVKEVAGHSPPWNAAEINAALKLKEEVLLSISTRASAVRTINERLQHAYEELDTFSYTISHDLKTPLTAIKGYAQLLATDEKLPPDAKFVSQRIADRTDRMNSMIKAILHYSRVARLPLDANLVDPTDIIKEIVQDLAQGQYKTKAKIEIGHMPPLHGDPILIWQVFSNLISNAVKYSQHADSPVVQIEGHANEKNIFYSVKDNGIGIADKDLDKVFLLFSRMDNVQDIEGTGVGLAIVKRIVEKHGGSIWAESQLGKGSTFYLSFTKK